MSNKDRDFYSIKPGFDSKNKELAFFIVTLPNEIPNILFKISY